MVDFAINSLLNSNRKSFKKSTLDESLANKNPFDLFDHWLQQAFDVDNDYANAMILSTVDENMMPDSRVVLLRNVSSGGLTFFTNYASKKGQDIDKNSNASVLFFWKEMERQVRIQGRLNFLPPEISDEYFESRPFESKVGATVSKQSAVVKNREIIDKLFKNALKKFELKNVPRPKNWGGYVLIPTKFEFWQGRNDRLHDRVQYVLDKNKEKWTIQRLMP